MSAMMETAEQHGAYANDDTRWEAVLGRDPAADGVFYYGVTSTGVYCRPTCPARRPQRERVAFFTALEAAEQAGFRPCRRCHPSEVSTQQQVVARLQTLLDTAERAPSLAALGQEVGLSPAHLQRVFKRATGLSPREYVAARRAERLKTALRRGSPVTAALYDAGYGSNRALYAAAPEQLGMSPASYRNGGAGERIAYGVFESPLGRMLIAATERGICALRFGEDTVLEAELRAEFPRATLECDDAVVAPYAQAVTEHLEGRRRDLVLPTDVQASAFQRRVWAALRQIPYGQTRSYSELAQMIGEPNAARAVARACATNPVAVVVPCHRVVRTGGALGGFRWGLDRKRRLLAQERAHAPDGAPVPAERPAQVALPLPLA